MFLIERISFIKANYCLVSKKIYTNIYFFRKENIYLVIYNSQLVLNQIDLSEAILCINTEYKYNPVK